jgi:hypothetical protein
MSERERESGNERKSEVDRERERGNERKSEVDREREGKRALILRDRERDIKMRLKVARKTNRD